MEAPLIQIDTPMGSFSVELYYQHAPKACKNFEGLAQKGYYDGTVFHRIIRDFMIQARKRRNLGARASERERRRALPCDPCKNARFDSSADP